jgi:diketogulonate reductase-like aldo/keto reductase
MDQQHVTVQGVEVPALGLGTWRLTGEECRETVETALDLGYRHLDTAQAYRNEREVGAALAASDVDREDVFLTTKLEFGNRRYDDVLRSTEESLSRLDTDHVDLLLVHQPHPTVPLKETLDAMNELRTAGKVEHIGVSNFSLERLKRAEDLSSAPIFTDQVQLHPYWPQSELLDYCRIHDRLLTAYSPLGQGGVLDDDRLVRIGERYDKSPAQVALRWLVQQENVAAIPKATSREHLEANLAVFDFELTDEEMNAVPQPSKLKTAWGILKGQYLRA